MWISTSYTFRYYRTVNNIKGNVHFKENDFSKNLMSEVTCQDSPLNDVSVARSIGASHFRATYNSVVFIRGFVKIGRFL
jgi:hypothetical protein